MSHWNTSGSNGHLFKTGGSISWAGGGISAKATKGDGEMAFRFSKRQNGMVGFGVGGGHNEFQDIDCALYMEHGSIVIYEKGSIKGGVRQPDGRIKGGLVGRYSDSTWVSVKRIGTQVQYKLGSRMLRTCGRRLSGDLSAVTSIHYPNRGGIIEAKWVSRTTTI